ncbi:hypothetical protein LOC68_25330 [Blastopirellula sp. JC732]|uniref:Uncharacterized protein n=1 Tax=Blastopirellula sediminis TaxID=2894196 RepID=A0A9X1MTE1_9BACT|nr:hypothetical protein [Blastopirellula sediminis]MCC9604968.1 hypothetical protein [Blastopirellula sediminis]MCC9631732.1 hypothetical protein [Blastopirellula sediminis]
MAAFAELDWRRFDVWAILAAEGVMTVQTEHRDACLAWLRSQNYGITSLDFANGVGPVVSYMGEIFLWEEQFGYKLTSDGGNLNALRDGFDFDLQPGQRHVLEIRNVDVAAKEDLPWLSGLLGIAHEYSRWQLALGARFFTLLALDESSPLIGLTYQTLTVPGLSWTKFR